MTALGHGPLRGGGAAVKAPPSRATGTVWCSGADYYGQLGQGRVLEFALPQAVSLISDAVAVSAGYLFSAFLRADGTVWAAGLNDFRELADGTTLSRGTPSHVGGLPPVTQISSGGYHTLALTGTGQVWAWGMNTGGQLGDGSTVERTTPVLPLLTGVVSGVGGGQYHSLAVKPTGRSGRGGKTATARSGTGPRRPGFACADSRGSTTRWPWPGACTTAWRSSAMAPCAPGGTTTTANWAMAPPPTGTPRGGLRVDGVVAIAAGYFHSLALKGDGTVWAWGSNWYGELGDGSSQNRSTPVQTLVPHLRRRPSRRDTAFSGALDTGGAAWAWGYNDNGRLGDGTTTRRRTPVRMQGVSGCTALDAGATTRSWRPRAPCRRPPRFLPAPPRGRIVSFTSTASQSGCSSLHHLRLGLRGRLGARRLAEHYPRLRRPRGRRPGR